MLYIHFIDFGFLRSIELTIKTISKMWLQNKIARKARSNLQHNKQSMNSDDKQNTAQTEHTTTNWRRNIVEVYFTFVEHREERKHNQQIYNG